MALRIGKVFFVVLLFYMLWFQEVYYSIPHMSTLLGLGLIIFIIIHAYKTKYSPKVKRYFPLELNILLLFGLTSFLFGLFIAPDKDLLIKSIADYFQHIALLYAIYYISVNDNKIDFPVYVFILVVLLSAITTTFWGYDYHHGRMSMGPKNNPNSLGIVMVVGTGLLLYTLNIKKFLSIIITFGLSTYFGYVTILTGSRKAFIAFILIFIVWIGILIITQFSKLSVRKKILYILIVFTAALLSYYVVLPFIKDLVLWRRLVRLFRTGDEVRTDMYKEAWEFFKRYPLFGVGFNQFRVLSKFKTYSHTTYGEALACTGIIGSILYFSTYLIITFRYFKQVFNRRLSLLISNKYKSLLALFGSLLFLGIGIIHFYGTTSLIALGLLISFERIHRKNEPKVYKGKIGVIRKIIDNPRLIIKILGDKKFFNFLPDKIYLKLVYWGETGKRLNLKNPKTYNEKLQWLKLYDRKKEYIQYVDKYEVREFISKTIGEEYLVPLIAVYDTIEEIPWDKLPQKFVLKCTHGSKSNIVCQNKAKLDINLAIKKLKRWMKKNWYWFGREWPYKHVKPRIIVEKYLMDNIIDYKILCFNGVPKLIQIHQNRDTSDYTMDYYTTDWEKTNIVKTGVKTDETIIEKPENLPEMLKIAEILSKNTYFARIDLYNVGNKIYFGEITLFPTSGFAGLAREEDELLLGSWINLPI